MPVLAERIASRIKEVSVEVDIRLAKPVPLPAPGNRLSFTLADVSSVGDNSVSLNKEYSTYSVSGTDVTGEEQVQIPKGSVFRIGDTEERYEVIGTGEGEVGDLVPVSNPSYSKSDFWRWQVIRNAGPAIPGSPKLLMLGFDRKLWVLDTVTKELSFALDLTLHFIRDRIHTFDVYYHSIPQEFGNDLGDRKWYLIFLTQGHPDNLVGSSASVRRLRFFDMNYVRAPHLDVLLPTTYDRTLISTLSFVDRLLDGGPYTQFTSMSLVIFNDPTLTIPRIYLYWVTALPSWDDLRTWRHYRMSIGWSEQLNRHAPVHALETFTRSFMYVRGVGSTAGVAFFQRITNTPGNIRSVRPLLVNDYYSFETRAYMKFWLPSLLAMHFVGTGFSPQDLSNNVLGIDVVSTKAAAIWKVTYFGTGRMYHFTTSQKISFDNRIELTLFDSQVRDRMYFPGGQEIGFDQSKDDDDDRYVLAGKQVFSNVVYFFPLLREDLAVGTKIVFVRTYGLGQSFPILLAFSGDFSGEYLYEAEGVVAYFLASQVDREITVDSQISFDNVVYRVISVVPRFARGHTFLYRLSLVRVENFQPSLESPVS